VTKTWTARIVDFTTHDGDTLVGVKLDVGWGVLLSRSGTAPLSIRLTSSAGPINAPETTGPEAQAGKLVSWYVDGALRAAKDLWVVSRELSRDAYGRCVGEIFMRGSDDKDYELGLRLADLKLVKACGPGGKRVPFTSEELASICERLGE